MNRGLILGLLLTVSLSGHVLADKHAAKDDSPSRNKQGGGASNSKEFSAAWFQGQSGYSWGSSSKSRDDWSLDDGFSSDSSPGNQWLSFAGDDKGDKKRGGDSGESGAGKDGHNGSKNTDGKNNDWDSHDGNGKDWGKSDGKFDDWKTQCWFSGDDGRHDDGKSHDHDGGGNGCIWDKPPDCGGGGCCGDPATPEPRSFALDLTAAAVFLAMLALRSRRMAK